MRMEWTELTTEGYAKFRPTFDPHITYARFQPRPTPDATNTTGTNRELSQAEAFKKSIKKDIRMFPTLKNEKEWNSYNRKLLAVARTQGVENILNPNYSPRTAEEIETFNAQNCYVWSAFVNTIETTKGLDLMRSHQATGNAHAFYKALVDHHQRSNAAKIEASSILTTLTQSDITKDRRGMSRTNYILKWSSLMKDYNEIVDADSCISDMLAKTMLARTLSCDNDFNTINTQDSISQAQGNGLLNYEDYKGIALDTAQNLDRREISTATKSLSKLGINETQIHDQEDDEYEPQLEVNRTSRNSRFGPTVDKATWNGLDAQSKEAWNNLTKEGREAVFNYIQGSDRNKGSNTKDPNITPDDRGRQDQTSNTYNNRQNRQDQRDSNNPTQSDTGSNTGEQ